MNFKPYKISESYQNNKPVPFIRLKEKWLEELNFNIGEDIEKIYENCQKITKRIL